MNTRGAIPAAHSVGIRTRDLGEARARRVRPDGRQSAFRPRPSDRTRGRIDRSLRGSRARRAVAAADLAVPSLLLAKLAHATIYQLCSIKARRALCSNEPVKSDVRVARP